MTKKTSVRKKFGLYDRANRCGNRPSGMNDKITV